MTENDIGFMGAYYYDPEGRFDCNLIPNFRCHGMFEHWNSCYMPNMQKELRQRFTHQGYDKPDKPEHPDHESAYEVTLTTTKDDPYELRTWIKKIAESKMFATISLPYSIELQDNGMPHIHGMLYSSKKRLDSSKLKALGFPYRYTFTRVKSLDAWYIYFNKEKNNPIIIDYCLRKGIPQFDNAKPIQTPTQEKHETQEGAKN